MKKIPVVDIFAGPGGLGEGFSAFVPTGKSQPPFRIAVSAEMELNAARTLRLRAFFRQFEQGQAPQSYYDYVAGRHDVPWTSATERQWNASGEEARQLTLGEAAHDAELHTRIGRSLKVDDPWVLIGGPPCQAYSLVGRARNRGIEGYSAEADHRHFLYRHYLSLIEKFRPAIFVMENVKGILSSKVGGELVFPRILEDLSHPARRGGPRYKVVPIVQSGEHIGLLDGASTDSSNFILRAERLGVPQARHRVVLLGVSEEIDLRSAKFMEALDSRFSVRQAIGDLPPLRGGITDGRTSEWSTEASKIFVAAARRTRREWPSLAKLLESRAAQASRASDPGTGSQWMPKGASSANSMPSHLKQWYSDKRLRGHLNHSVRGHMTADLARYAYAAMFTELYGRSPKGASEFPVGLHPDHANWDSGKFVDRFKVQSWDHPSSTITSHLSKDGHYFIHPDASQLRSISPREAARLQTFPDNYFFEGSRTAQFKQVGNAVPPYMAQQIAGVVYSLL